jgi:hypothetical protein
LKIAHNAAEAQEDIDHELDNKFDLSEVTIQKTIPYVRELTNAVLIDGGSTLPASFHPIPQQLL